jgi:hypothetical protein
MLRHGALLRIGGFSITPRQNTEGEWCKVSLSRWRLHLSLSIIASSQVGAFEGRVRCNLSECLAIFSVV